MCCPVSCPFCHWVIQQGADTINEYNSPHESSPTLRQFGESDKRHPPYCTMLRNNIWCKYTKAVEKCKCLVLVPARRRRYEGGRGQGLRVSGFRWANPPQAGTLRTATQRPQSFRTPKRRDLLFFCLQVGLFVRRLLGSLQGRVVPFGRGSCLIVWEMGCLKL